jgi:hypothetical protein
MKMDRRDVRAVAVQHHEGRERGRRLMEASYRCETIIHRGMTRRFRPIERSLHGGQG